LNLTLVKNVEVADKQNTNLLEYGDDELSKQSTQITNNEHLRYMSVLGSGGGAAAFGFKRKRLGSKKKKMRKSKKDL